MISSAKMTPGWTGGRVRFLGSTKYSAMMAKSPSVVLLQINQVGVAFPEFECDAPRPIYGHAIALRIRSLERMRPEAGKVGQVKRAIENFEPVLDALAQIGRDGRALALFPQ